MTSRRLLPEFCHLASGTLLVAMAHEAGLRG